MFTPTRDSATQIIRELHGIATDLIETPDDSAIVTRFHETSSGAMVYLECLITDMETIYAIGPVVHDHWMIKRQVNCTTATDAARWLDLALKS